MVTRLAPRGEPAPLVVDSPHSGRYYPPDFGAAVSRVVLVGGEDRFVDQLFADAPEHGATMIAARFARTYMDANRRLEEMDPDLVDGEWPYPVTETQRTRLGVGLVFRLIGPGLEIYDRRLSVAEARGRIERCWRPYHDALAAAIAETHARHGVAFHLNCHSMEPIGNELSPDPGVPRPHFVLGDRNGTACAPEFTAVVAATLRGMGYTVALNNPYSGADLVERYSDPARNRHSLQIEVNRALYMGGPEREKHEGFDALRRDLGSLIARLADFARDRARLVTADGDRR